MKPTRFKTPAKPSAFVPQTKDECAETINKIGLIQREIQRIQTKMNDELAVITDKYTGSITDQIAILKHFQDGVQTYCEAHRDALTQNGKTKSGEFVTGSVMWRQKPPSVLAKGIDSIIETLNRLGLSRFVRVKNELNKEAILNEPDAIKGIAGLTIKTGVEDFVITTFEQELT